MEAALLAPVPEEHLVTGLKKCQAVGKVAFGSRAFQVFRDLEELAAINVIDVYIYASYSKKFGPPKVRWKARYLGHVESIGGAHPDGMKYRPETTEANEADNSGYWAVFWEVADLHELSKEDSLSMNLFRGWNSKKQYASAFIPEGPIIVEAP